MTHRQRMEAVFRGQLPDVMGWFGDLTYWYHAHEQIGDLPARWQGPDGLHEMHRELNVGEYIPGCDACTMAEADQVEHTVQTTGLQRIESWHTPMGSIRQVQEYSYDSYSWGYTEHAVKDVNDLRVVRYLYENRTYTPCPENYLKLDRGYADYGFGPTHYAGPPTPISELNKHWVGVMDLTFLLMDEPEEMNKTFDAIQQAHDTIYRHIVRGPKSYVMVCENLTAQTMGGYFDQYIAPHLKRWSGWLHGAGHRTMIHNDGTLLGTLDKLGATGIQCVDSVVPKPVGDVAPEDLRAVAGDEIIMLGGLPGAMFAPPYTAKDIERQVMKLIELYKDSGTFMFGVADQVPPNGDLELVRLVGQLVEKYGRYSCGVSY